MPKTRFSTLLAGTAVAAMSLSGCASTGGGELPPATFVSMQEGPGEEYVIGPLDELTIHVWRNPELGAEKIQVRPDGRITIPLVQDMPAVGKTPAMLQEDIRLQLSQFIEEPLVSVIVTKFAATTQQIRVIGATQKPASIPYRANMTVLDAMIAVGGLSEFAAGNRAKLIRFDKRQGRQREYALKLGDLLRKGDSRANVMLMPGDVIIIPESMF
ncbi:MAG: polysaccharide biosynthesis/export family protein [Sphingomonadaceae bacterium]|nr:polysaccharide biosynthesis/export family protein [Sphingomonadaceae bacterium]